MEDTVTLTASIILAEDNETDGQEPQTSQTKSESIAEDQGTDGQEQQSSQPPPNRNNTKIEDISNFLTTRFRIEKGAETTKARVVHVVHSQYDAEASPAVIGRAVSGAFGKKLHNHGKRCKVSYPGLMEYTVQKATAKVSSLTTTTDFSDVQVTRHKRQLSDTSSSSEPKKVPKPMRETRSPPYLDNYELPNIQKGCKVTPIQSSPFVMKSRQTQTMPQVLGGSYTIKTAAACTQQASIDSKRTGYNIAMNLSLEEARFIGELRKNSRNGVKYMIKEGLFPDIQSAVTEYTCEQVQTEMKCYAAIEESVMRKSSAAEMESFSFASCWQEFQDHLPTLTRVIVSACTRKDQDNRKLKTKESLIPPIAMTVGKCVGIYSSTMSAVRTMYSLILSDGGIRDACMNRLARLYDTITHQSLLTKLNDMSTRYNKLLDDWKSQLQEYSIVIDNVDIFVRPRRECKEKSNIMNHMVQAIAVSERVKPDASISQAARIPIDDLKARDVYPTQSDDITLKEMMVAKVLEIIARLPALKEVPLKSPSESHKYSAETSKKTNIVHLGVLKKNENVKEELLYCLKDYHKLAEDKNSEDLLHKLCVGDYLTFERGQQVLNTQCDGKTPRARLEGLMMAMADFHVQMNFLKMIYDTLFKGDSQPSTGTLSHAKNFLNARNVTANPATQYYNCGALFDKVFHAYIYTAAVKELGLLSLDDEKGKYVTPETVERAARRIVDMYVDISVPDLEETGKIRCCHCPKKYTTKSNLRKHHQLMHPDLDMTDDEQGDAVFNHTCLVIVYGLLRSLHNRSIQLGNGEQIMLFYRYMFIMFKANGKYKYGCGLLETLIQVEVLPAPMSLRLVWNRFFNSYSKSDTNIPLDLALEHENREFKKRLKTYYGVYTQPHIDRISRARGVLVKIIKRLDHELDYHQGSKPAKRDDKSMNDIKLLAEKYQKEDLLTLSSTSPRSHSPTLLTVPANPISGTNGKSLRQWMDSRMELIRVRHYYQQYSQVAASFVDSTSSSIYGNLYTEWADRPV